MELERKICIGDTGFIVALMNRKDERHQEVVNIYTKESQILLPQTVLAEVAYLVGRAAGPVAVANTLRFLPSSRFRLLALEAADLVRVAEILEEYQDSRIDFVDATVMAIAERYKITKILTLDHRDFRLFRPRHCQSFNILP